MRLNFQNLKREYKALRFKVSKPFNYAERLYPP
jgi:hypothetical protein